MQVLPINGRPSRPYYEPFGHRFPREGPTACPVCGALTARDVNGRRFHHAPASPEYGDRFNPSYCVGGGGAA